MCIHNKNELYMYTIQVDTFVWLIHIIDATLIVASTNPLRFGMEDSPSWCYKHAEKNIKKNNLCSELKVNH